MDKNEFQSLWDQMLIEAWVANVSMGQMVYRFIFEAAPILAKLHDFKRMIQYINSLELLRCRDIYKYKQQLVVNRFPVRAWVDQHSPQLTGFLYSDHDNGEILENIANFKWRMVDRDKVNCRNANNKHKGRVKHGVYLTVKARELDKNHDWKTVK